MERVGNEHGCGRAMWEYEPELDRLGTPMALMLLPYWTDGCIGSMEGLFFESAASTPYHFLNQSELSARPSRPQRDLRYRDLNVAEGVRTCRSWACGTTWRSARTAKQQADAEPDLKLDRRRPRTWSATINENGTSAVQSRGWKIYLVKDSAIVEPLKYLPGGHDQGAQGRARVAGRRRVRRTSPQDARRAVRSVGSEVVAAGRPPDDDPPTQARVGHGEGRRTSRRATTASASTSTASACPWS